VMDTSRAEDLADWAASELELEVVDRGQSNSFAVMDYERLMEALREGWLRHTGDPGLRRHVLNAVTKTLTGGDARFWRHSQTRQGGDQDRRVIDALTALAMIHTTLAAELAPSVEPWMEVW
jgi:hypothetical protein